MFSFKCLLLTIVSLTVFKVFTEHFHDYYNIQYLTSTVKLSPVYEICRDMFVCE